MERLIAACVRLEDLPNRGAPRDEILPGLRILGFERRVAIAYRVADSIEILRVFYGGQDWEHAFGGELA
jgi:toxin ParE1/3/4